MGLRTIGWAYRPNPDLQVGLPTFPTPPGGSPDPSLTSGWVSRPFPDLWVGLPILPGPSGGTPEPSRRYRWDSRTTGWAY